MKYTNRKYKSKNIMIYSHWYMYDPPTIGKHHSINKQHVFDFIQGIVNDAKISFRLVYEEFIYFQNRHHQNLVTLLEYIQRYVKKQYNKRTQGAIFGKIFSYYDSSYIGKLNYIKKKKMQAAISLVVLEFE